jgi:hypothetical protein
MVSAPYAALLIQRRNVLNLTIPELDAEAGLSYEKRNRQYGKEE